MDADVPQCPRVAWLSEGALVQLTVYAIDGITPVVDPSAYVHPSAVLIGDVIIGPGVYIGPCASLRGDFGRLEVRAGANVQDACVMHGFPGTDTIVEEDGHIGHGAVLHGCIVQRNALVGMNAVVNDNAVIGESAMVAAMAFVKAGFVVPPRMLVAGVPGKLIRELTDQELGWKTEGTRSYQDLTRRSIATMTATVPLAAPEADRRRIVVDDLKPLSVLKSGLRT
jgi:phenylacetic acid degradation protein